MSEKTASGRELLVFPGVGDDRAGRSAARRLGARSRSSGRAKAAAPRLSRGKGRHAFVQ